MPAAFGVWSLYKLTMMMLCGDPRCDTLAVSPSCHPGILFLQQPDALCAPQTRDVELTLLLLPQQSPQSSSAAPGTRDGSMLCLVLVVGWGLRYQQVGAQWIVVVYLQPG